MTPAAAYPAVAFPPLTHAQMAGYLAASGDDNAIHADAEAAARAGLPDMPAPGLLTMAMLEGAVHRWLPGQAVDELSVTFTAPVFPGDSLTAHARLASRARTGDEEQVTLRIRLTGADGRIAAIGAVVFTIPAAG